MPLGVGGDGTGGGGVGRCTTEGACEGCAGSEDAAVQFCVECAPVCGLVELVKAGCSLRSELNVVLIETVSTKAEGQI